MNVKLNNCFFVLVFLMFLFGALSMFVFDNKKENEIYFKKIESVFDNLSSVEEMLNLEIKNYFENNKVSKYSIKEMRDKYSNSKNYAKNTLRELKALKHYENLNKRYLIDILNDVIEVIDNDFLVNDIFYSSDEVIVKSLQEIMYDFKKVLNKYNVFKINFGISNI